MNLHQVVQAGRSGFVYTMLGISFALLAGMGLGALLGVQRVPAFLISTGTAICGGSAIAAVGPITQASDEEMAIALGTVFVLNSVALLIFPAIGAALKLTPIAIWIVGGAGHSRHQFGGGRGGQVWSRGPGHCDHGETGARFVDCSALGGHGGGARRQGQDSVAVVHWLFLPRGGVQHVSSGWSARLLSRGEDREDRLDRDSVSDRQRHLGGNHQTGGTSSAAAGNYPVAAGFGGIVVADSHGMDCAVKQGKKAKKWAAKKHSATSAL